MTFLQFVNVLIALHAGYYNLDVILLGQVEPHLVNFTPLVTYHCARHAPILGGSQTHSLGEESLEVTRLG